MKKLSYTKEEKLWRWEVSGEENRYYCTNSEGEGIFEVSFSPLGGDRHQLTGTCQFDLSGLSDAWAKKKIRKWMEETGRLDEEDW